VLIRFNAPLWEWQAKAAWFFLTLPVEESGMIRMAANAGGKKRGFGSVRVKATIGKTSWNTSIFPNKKSGTYLLPVKADVRKAEGLIVGVAVEVTLSLDL
jgi:hypothetical protein